MGYSNPNQRKENQGWIYKSKDLLGKFGILGFNQKKFHENEPRQNQQNNVGMVVLSPNQNIVNNNNLAMMQAQPINFSPGYQGYQANQMNYQPQPNYNYPQMDFGNRNQQQQMNVDPNVHGFLYPNQNANNEMSENVKDHEKVSLKIFIFYLFE